MFKSYLPLIKYSGRDQKPCFLRGYRQFDTEDLTDLFSCYSCWYLLLLGDVQQCNSDQKVLLYPCKWKMASKVSNRAKV